MNMEQMADDVRIWHHRCEAALHSALSDIHYQLFTPTVKTMGCCPECGEPSRGAEICARCIGKLRLAPLVGVGVATAYVKCAEMHAKARAKCWKAIEDDEVTE